VNARAVDRPLGLAHSQTLVYSHEDNEITVDTTHRGAVDCARDVVGRLDDLGDPKAFERLRAAQASQD
jgi:chloramphenicol 3-O phosphotransferase